MILNNKGEIESSGSFISHILLWVVLIGLAVFLTWSAVNKKTEDNTYQRGAVDASHATNVYPLGLSMGGCQYIRPDGKPINAKNIPSVNASKP